MNRTIASGVWMEKTLCRLACTEGMDFDLGSLLGREEGEERQCASLLGECCLFLYGWLSSLSGVWFLSNNTAKLDLKLFNESVLMSDSQNFCLTCPAVDTAKWTKASTTETECSRKSILLQHQSPCFHTSLPTRKFSLSLTFELLSVVHADLQSELVDLFKNPRL